MTNHVNLECFSIILFACWTPNVDVCQVCRLVIQPEQFSCIVTRNRGSWKSVSCIWVNGFVVDRSGEWRKSLICRELAIEPRCDRIVISNYWNWIFTCSSEKTESCWRDCLTRFSHLWRRWVISTMTRVSTNFDLPLLETFPQHRSEKREKLFKRVLLKCFFNELFIYFLSSSFLTILTFWIRFKRKQFTAIRCRDFKYHRRLERPVPTVSKGSMQ